MIASTLLCLIVGITDGNTLTARCGEPQAYEQVTVRLAAIDAPEKNQPYGRRAREALSEMALGKTAELRCHSSEPAPQRSCSVWVSPVSAADGPLTLDAGLAMLTVGLAWWNPDSAHEQAPQERGQYAFAQQEARAKRAGLWSAHAPVAPWDWRKNPF